MGIKGGSMAKEITVEKLHNRLTVVEVVVFISLVLNAVSGFLALKSHQEVKQVQEQTGVQQ